MSLHKTRTLHDPIAWLAAIGFLIGGQTVFAEGNSTPPKPLAAAESASAKVMTGRTDSWTTAHIKEQFRSDQRFVSAAIVEGRGMSVMTQHHEVTLTGLVESRAAHDAALSIARDTEGVTKVIDHLELAPSR